MSKKVMGYIVTLVVLAVAVTGGVYYAVVQHNKPLTQEQFANLSIEEQFKRAPSGHYVHLLKNDPTIYRTTWSKEKIKKHLLYTSGHVKTKSDGTSNEKTNLGTSRTFDDSILVDAEKGYGEVGQYYFALTDNYKFNKEIAFDEDYTYNWYFDDLKAAQKDADVSANVTQIYR
ncbi:hypothetical protein B9D04_04130 [Weissella cibaria]|uniref:Uncharacterized protein n=1 Tax=Weissella cibaria TaxID=137591 RepID=A0A1X4JLQ1_9LACO|nr:hypothetical protein [Weissella cibaria]OSP89714.1 hypothetical protein B9D04_04130 [Weissella cibaria]